VIMSSATRRDNRATVSTASIRARILTPLL
jgi:hypothetical protein